MSQRADTGRTDTLVRGNSPDSGEGRGDVARRRPFDAAGECHLETEAVHRINRMAKRRVEDAALAERNHHERWLLLVGFVGESGGEHGDVFRGATEPVIEFVVCVQPFFGEAAQDGVVGARLDQELVLRSMATCD